MLMHNPPHPGLVIKELCLEPLGLSVTDAAKALGVSRKTLACVINGKAGVSPEMAVRLSIAFNTSSESWVTQQGSMIFGMLSNIAMSLRLRHYRPPEDWDAKTKKYSINR
ncbi:putative HTH-type transcriptional regulator YddM [Gammaproteobacteria bacterium MOLA455]|nr:putative HTH-type transcriptional regulator YddM [Gammaproteobacteria bacterium MOLA455]